MARIPLMVDNWKMNLDHLEAIQLVNQLHLDLVDHHYDFDAVEVAVIPPFTDIRSVQTTIDGDSMKIRCDIQDMSVHDNGAFTGEVSTTMLTKLGCTYMMVGHSERREYHNETDAVVNAKARKILAAGMVPIVCCGEALDARKAGKHVEHVLGQIVADFADISAAEAEKCVVAYEPIQVIGTGETAIPQDVQEVCDAIRQKLVEIYSTEVADKMRIPYDGSMRSANVADIMAEPDVGGGLVGGVSLKAEEFGKICRIGKQFAQFLEPTVSCRLQNS